MMVVVVGPLMSVGTPFRTGAGASPPRLPPARAGVFAAALLAAAFWPAILLAAAFLGAAFLAAAFLGAAFLAGRLLGGGLLGRGVLSGGSPARRLPGGGSPAGGTLARSRDGRGRRDVLPGLLGSHLGGVARGESATSCRTFGGRCGGRLAPALGPLGGLRGRRRSGTGRFARRRSAHGLLDGPGPRRPGRHCRHSRPAWTACPSALTSAHVLPGRALLLALGQGPSGQAEDHVAPVSASPPRPAWTPSSPATHGRTPGGSCPPAGRPRRRTPRTGARGRCAGRAAGRAAGGRRGSCRAWPRQSASQKEQARNEPSRPDRPSTLPVSSVR